MAKPSDNSLGAPTEGLGQNVTFAYNTGRGPGQLEIGDPGRIRAGVIGGDPAGGSTRAQGVQDPGANATLEVLMKVGESIMAPMLKQRKAEAYVAGMQRAMQGEAVTEIANEQPWYSKIFGDSDVVEGARAYASNTLAQTTVNDMEARMPELRKLGAQEAQAYFVDTVMKSATGDPATDLAVMQSLTRTLPSLMKRQAKEHYGYQQERATAAEDTSFRSAAEALQAQGNPLSTGYVSPEEFANKQRAFIRGQVPAAGRDEKNWKDAQTARYIKAARAGQFHAVNAGYMPLEEGAPSAIEALDERQQTAIAAAVEAGQSLMVNKYSEKWAPDLAKLQYDAAIPAVGDTPQALGERIDGINLKFQAETGSRQGLISPRAKAALMTRSGSEIAQELAEQARERKVEEKAAAKAGDKVKAAALETSTYEAWFSTGKLGDLVKQPDYSSEKADAVAFPKLAAMPVDERVAAMLRLRNGGFTSERLKSDLSGRMAGMLVTAGEVGYTPAVQAAFDDYLRVYKADPALAAKYYDGEGGLGNRLQGWAQAVTVGRTDPIDAFNYHMRGPQKRTRLDAKETAVVVKEVTSSFNGWTQLWMGDNALKPGQAGELTRTISGEVADLAAATGDVEGAVKTVMHNTILNKSMEVVGGYVTGRAKNQASLADYLSGVVPGLKRDANAVNIGTDKVHQEFSDAIDAIMFGSEEKGVRGVTDESNPIRVIRYADTLGVPTYKALMMVDGVAKEAIFTADEIPKWAAARRKQAAAGTGPIAARPSTPFPSPTDPRLNPLKRN